MGESFFVRRQHALQQRAGQWLLLFRGLLFVPCVSGCLLLWATVALAQAGDPNLVLVRPVKVSYLPPKKGTPIRRVIAPLLALRWQVRAFNRQPEEAGDCTETPAATASYRLVERDKMRLAVEINQAGYLYVINHTETAERRIIQGPNLISTGQYKLDKNLEQIVPPVCRPQDTRCGNCYWTTYQPYPAGGYEVVTLIFSRYEIEELKNPKNEDISVSATRIEELRKRAGVAQQRVLPEDAQRKANLSGVTGQHVTLAWNPNARNNGLLVEQIRLQYR